MSHFLTRDSTIALISLCLGISAGVSLTVIASYLYGTGLSIAEVGSFVKDSMSSTDQPSKGVILPTWMFAAAVYVLSSIVPFHFGEFFVASQYRPEIDGGPHAFMIYHSNAYFVANMAAWMEFLIESLLLPVWLRPLHSLTSHPIWVMLWGGVTLTMYLIRIVAMVQCKSNFSLEIEVKHRNEHELVTTGIYSYLRHPSYFGWFWRTSCSQLILANPVCFIGFVVVTWKFFKERIREEETLLASDEFFGEKYDAYRKNTYIGIPFIS
eukprot:Tbor_TRINITY_DN3450_c0_g1::TRINITY_DN3450_c0_g1_i1::g.3702::m.3702/K00587/ICMT, STE14; protein-S-isoprenylcysteine O-methyltransferase